MADTRERHYAILLVSASDKFNMTVKKVLPAGWFRRIEVRKSVATAQRELVDQQYDVVIIHAPLPDSLGIELALDAGCRTMTEVMLITPQEIVMDVAEQVSDHGIFVLSSGSSESEIGQMLRALCAVCEKLHQVEERRRKLEDKLDEQKLLNRAKWLLVSQKGMSEPEAHRYIGKQAMDRCLSKRVVCKEIVDEWEE